MAEHVAYFAVFAFADGEGEPQVRALHAIERRIDLAVVDAGDGDAGAQFVELPLRDRAVCAHAIAPQPAGSGQFESAGERAVIGEQKESFGVEIEPADADEARQAFGQMRKQGRPALRIRARGQQAPRIVVEEEPRALTRRQWLAIDADAVAGGDVERGRLDHCAVDSDPPGGDPFLRLAARGETGAGNHFGDTFAAFVVALVRASHVDSIPSWPGSRSKNGVAWFADARPSTSWCGDVYKDVDARHKAGHDGGRNGFIHGYGVGRSPHRR